MNIYTTAWKTAIKRPDKEKFEIIPTDFNFWAADPFLFYHNNKLYIFAELWFYKENRGAIGYYCMDDKMPQWKVIIKEAYHLSYPHLFLFNNEIYMCPEANESKTITLYRAVSFPDKWEKLAPLKTGLSAADTTFFLYDKDMYCFTYLLDKQELYLYKVNTNTGFSLEPHGDNPINSDLATARMAGNILRDNGQYIRVSQNCSKYYGEALMFSSFEIGRKGYKETFIRRMDVSNFEINSSQKYIGVHTYNRVNGFEIIDLKYKYICLYDILFRTLRKIRGCFYG